MRLAVKAKLSHLTFGQHYADIADLRICDTSTAGRDCVASSKAAPSSSHQRECLPTCKGDHSDPCIFLSMIQVGQRLRGAWRMTLIRMTKTHSLITARSACLISSNLSTRISQRVIGSLGAWWRRLGSLSGHRPAESLAATTWAWPTILAKARALLIIALFVVDV